MREVRKPVTLEPPGLRLLPVAVVAVVLLPAVALGSAGPQITSADRLEGSVLDELNLVRLEYGRSQLKLSSGLTAAADSHTLEMVRAGYFGHESADGSHFARRIKGFYRPLRRPWTVGENLIWQERRLSARAAVAAWLASPGHRENLLEPDFREVGIAAVRAQGAPGVYGNRQVVVLTVDFGAR